MATKETQLVKEKQNVPNKTRVGVSVCLLTAPSKVVTKASLRVPDGNLKKKNENIVWQRKKARAYEEKCLGELLFVFTVCRHVTVGWHMTGSVWTSPHLPSQHIPPFTALQRKQAKWRVRRERQIPISASHLAVETW